MTKPTGNPRGRPRNARDLAGKIREFINQSLAGAAAGIKADLKALKPRERIAALSRLAEIGITLDRPVAKEEGITVRFILSGVRPGDDASVDALPGDVVDVTPIRPALPSAQEPMIDPRLYVPHRQPELVEPVREKTAHELEQERLRQELADELERMDNAPRVPDWRRWR